jgi:hypothetical protein
MQVAAGKRTLRNKSGFGQPFAGIQRVVGSLQSTMNDWLGIVPQGDLALLEHGLIMPVMLPCAAA